MRDFLARGGYPDGASLRRPILWTLLLLFMAVATALPPHGTTSGRFLEVFGLLCIGHYTGQSWRKHRQPVVEPLGQVAWTTTGSR